MINEIQQVTYEQAITDLKLKGIWPNYLSNKHQKKVAKTVAKIIQKNPPKK